jgi:Family of unknown function (DUF6636)
MRLCFIAVCAFVAALTSPVFAGHSSAAVHEIHFMSPSGNIHCRGSGSGMACLLVHNNWSSKPRRPSTCDLDWSPTDMSLYVDVRGRWRVGVGGCRGDIGPLCYPQEPCVVLRYGRSLTATDGSRRIRCTSRANGVTCLRLGAGKGLRGFRIAREGYAVLQ